MVIGFALKKSAPPRLPDKPAFAGYDLASQNHSLRTAFNPHAFKWIIIHIHNLPPG